MPKPRARDQHGTRGEALTHQRADDLAHGGRIAQVAALAAQALLERAVEQRRRRPRPRGRRRGPARCRAPTGPAHCSFRRARAGPRPRITVSSRAAARAIRDSSRTPLACSRATTAVDRLGGDLAAGEALAQLARRQLARREPLQGEGVGVGGRRAPDAARRRQPPKRVISGAPTAASGAGAGLRPRMVLAIWSRDSSEVVEMPWILSLNSSTFEAQRSASS